MPITICDVSKFAEIALKPVPACTCGNCNATNHWEFYGEDDSHFFECEGCKRSVPWCFGADDMGLFGESLLDYCDDCASAVIEFQEQVIALQSASDTK